VSTESKFAHLSSGGSSLSCFLLLGYRCRSRIAKQIRDSEYGVYFDYGIKIGIVPMKRRCLGQLAIVSLLICSACGGGGSTGSIGPPPPTVTSVSVSPSSANVQPGAAQQFTATVTGTGDFPNTVTWSVSGQSDDANLGTISASGLYTADNNPPNPNTVTVTATSTYDRSKSASASVVVGSSAFQITGITISPTSANLKTTQTQQFTATVQGTGSFSNAVIWSMVDESSGNSVEGTISATGLYTAPEEVPSNGSVTVEVRSAVDSSVRVLAPVALTQNPPTITQLSPSTANASDTVELIGTGFAGMFAAANGIVTVIFPGPNGIPLAVLPDPSTSSLTQLFVVVPLSAVSGQVIVQVQSLDGSTQHSNAVAFIRLPRVRIRAAQRDLSAGESVSFQSRILGSGTTETLTWSVDVGSVSSEGTYTAPASVASDTYAVVTACVQGTQICDQERLGLHPFRISPLVPIVSLGNSVELSGIQGSASVAPTWQLNGPGSLSPSGDYTASSQLAGGGGVPVVGTYNGYSEQASLSATGGFPGMVNRVADYVDLNQTPFPLGTWVENVGIAGNSAYVEAADYWNGDSQNYYWVDVYDVSDPTNPVWTDAFEPAALGQLLSCNGYLYQFAGQDDSQSTTLPGVIAVYDITGPHPVLLSRQISPVSTPVITSQDGCLITEISLAAYEAVSASEAPVVIDQFKLQNGTVGHTQYSLPVPSSIATPSVDGFASDGNLVYLRVNSDLITYDLTTQPPSQVGLLDTGYGLLSQLNIVGSLLFMTAGVTGIESAEIFDISTPQPVLVATLPIGSVLASSGMTVIAGTNQTGLRTVNIGNPLQPKLVGSSFDDVNAQYSTVAISDNFALTSEGEGGLAIYDTSESGGLFPSYMTVSGGAVPGGPALAQIANSSNLYFAIGNAVYGAGVLDFDLSTTPPTYLGSFSTGMSASQALALNQQYLYVGVVDSLRVLDVSNPANPSQVESISVGIASLAISGNWLFAGTVDDRLVVYDVSQPSSPVQETSLTLPGLPAEMVVSGTLLLVADGTAGLVIYNIASPSAPVLLSQTKPSSQVVDVAVDGNLALLAGCEAGLVIVDITNPASPQVVGQAALDTIDPYEPFQSFLLNKAATIAVANKIAFIGVYNADTSDPPENGNGMIYGFDYTQPANPRLVYLGANGVIADAVLTLRFVGSNLFAGITSGLTEFDVSQPRNVVNLLFLPSALRPPVYLEPALDRALQPGRGFDAARQPEGDLRFGFLPNASSTKLRRGNTSRTN
jgi:hypothetical protein